MLEMGRMDEKVLIGLCLALVVHMSILSIPLKLFSTPLNEDKQFTVKLKSRKPVQESKPDTSKRDPSLQQIAATKSTASDIPVPTPTPVTEKSIETALDREIISVRPTTRAAQTRLAVSPFSSQFKRFIESENESDRARGSPQQAEFAESFGTKFPTVNKPKDMPYSQSPLGGGNYKVVRNGKVRCQLQMVPLTIDDQNYAFPPTTKDCSPPEKFDLKLNRPIDGNMDMQ